jgi:hypothetical protein
MPADGTSAATGGNGDFGRSPIFGQLSDKLLLVLFIHVGVPDLSTRVDGNLNAENLLAV